MSSIVSLEIDGSPFAMETAGENLNVKGFANLENTITAENVTSSPISLTGGELADEISLTGEGNATILGEGGDDYIVSSSGDDTLLGGEGNDTIIGGSGADLINGGDGEDLIKGGMGADVLQGGGGDDVFEFMAEEFASDAVDEIKDFEDMGDIIKIMGVGEDSTVTYDEVTGMVSIDGDAVIDLGEGMDIEATKNDDTWELF